MAKPKVDTAALAELKFLQEQEVATTRELALDDLWFLMSEVLWPKEMEEHFQEDFHKPIADRVTAAQPGCRDLLLAPRASRKTMLRLVAHVVWRILRDPNIRILIVSALDDTAKKFLGVIKMQFQKNPGIKKYFPEFVLPLKVGTEYEFTHSLRTNINLIDPTVRATYLGAPFLGRRCDLMVLDDPIDDKHVATPDQADKSLQWINVLFPLVDRNPRYNMVFVNATRKAFNDPYAAMLGESRGEDAKEEFTEPPFQSVIRGALEDVNGNPDINGEPTFEKVLSKAVLMEELNRSRMQPQLGEAYFFREYLNLCQSPGSKKFYEEWFDTWTPVLPSNIVWGGIAFDSALKDKAVNVGGDFTVMLVAHFDSHGHLYFTDGARSDRWRTMDFLRELAAMAQRNGGTYNIVKQKVGEDPLAGIIEHYFHELKMPATIYALTVAHEGSKIVRNINALQGPMQARKVHFVGDPTTGRGFPVALWRVLRDEACHIGQWSHDDGIDAMSCFFHKDIRIIPSTGRAVEWKPMHNARLIQGSTAQFNRGAVRARMKVAAPAANPWEQRALAEFQEALGLPGGTDMKRPALRELPFTINPGKADDVW